jgi:hypothetical protein
MSSGVIYRVGHARPSAWLRTDGRSASFTAFLCAANRSTRLAARAASGVSQLVDDYEVVLDGVAAMFDRYQERIRIVEIDANEAVAEPVDIVLTTCSRSRSPTETR